MSTTCPLCEFNDQKTELISAPPNAIEVIVPNSIQTIYGAELVTIMNNAINKNTENNVQKDNKGNYINNNNNSIQIDIKFKDVDKTFNMETIYNGTMEKFVENYNNIQFVCSKIEYHKNTKLVKYLLFEQITQ